MGHCRRTELSCRTAVQQHLLQEGILTFRHVTSVDGHLLNWDDRAVIDLAPAWQRCYSKMISTLQPVQIQLPITAKKQQVFVASIPLVEGSAVWQFEMTRAQRIQRWMPGALALSAKHTCRFTRGLLAHTFHGEPPQDLLLTQLVTTPNLGSDAARFPHCIIGSVFDAVGQSVQYLWHDGSEFFSADTWHLRIIQSPRPSSLHIGPHKWTIEFSWQP